MYTNSQNFKTCTLLSLKLVQADPEIVGCHQPCTTVHPFLQASTTHACLQPCSCTNGNPRLQLSLQLGKRLLASYTTFTKSPTITSLVGIGVGAVSIFTKQSFSWRNMLSGFTSVFSLSDYNAIALFFAPFRPRPVFFGFFTHSYFARFFLWFCSQIQVRYWNANWFTLPHFREVMWTVFTVHVTHKELKRIQKWIYGRLHPCHLWFPACSMWL